MKFSQVEHNKLSLLLSAIKQKDVSEVEELLKAGDTVLDPPSELHKVNKPLAFVAAYGNLEIVTLLVEAGADLNGQVAYGDVPLIKAHEHENDDIAEYLIKEGADVNAPNLYGITPFIGFCGTGQLRFMELAHQYGGDVNLRFESKIGKHSGQMNSTPLQTAVSSGKTEVVLFLLAHGADPNVKDSRGRTLLDVAESKGYIEIAGLLREIIKVYPD